MHISPFFRFLLTGGLNTLFGYLTFTFFVYVTGNPSWSIVLATIINVLFNFKTYGRFVFKSNDNSRFYRFCSAYAVLTTLQVLILKYMNFLGITNPYIAGAMLTLPMAALSYLTIKKFVFHQPLIPESIAHPENEVKVLP